MASPLFFLLPSSSSSSLSLPKSHLSFLSSSPNPLRFPSFQPHKKTLTLTLPPIRMGGGPRTFPGGVSKWQWKRMQSKKSKQLLKARLLRERQIYEMRKRAELKAAVSELEKPWEMVERVAPNLFSVSADDQVKALADRFQRPGGFDMWSHRDGPQMFRRADSSLLPSARFFPKGVVHSIKPYGPVGRGGSSSSSSGDDDDAPQVFDDWIARGGGGVSSSRRRRRRSSEPRSISLAADPLDVEILGGSEVEDVECTGVVRRNANGNANKGRRSGNIVLRPAANLYHGGDRNQRMGMDLTRKNHQGDRRLRGHSADPLDVTDRSGEGQGRHLDHREGVRSNSYIEDVECTGVVRRNANWNANKGRRNGNSVLRPTANLYHGGDRNQRMGMDVTRNNYQGDRRLRGHSADPLDVELTDRSGEGQGRHLDRREGVRSNSYEKGNSNAVDRRKYGMINRWQRVDRNDRLNLRPTSDLHNEGGNKEMVDSRWNMEGNGVRRNNRISK